MDRHPWEDWPYKSAEEKERIEPWFSENIEPILDQVGRASDDKKVWVEDKSIAFRQEGQEKDRIVIEFSEEGEPLGYYNRLSAIRLDIRFLEGILRGRIGSFLCDRD